MIFGPTTEAPRRLLVPVSGASNAHPMQSAMKPLFVPAAGSVRRRTRGPPRGVHIIRILFVHRPSGATIQRTLRGVFSIFVVVLLLGLAGDRDPVV
jgi:hypothetical protein